MESGVNMIQEAATPAGQNDSNAAVVQIDDEDSIDYGFAVNNGRVLIVTPKNAINCGLPPPADRSTDQYNVAFHTEKADGINTHDKSSREVTFQEPEQQQP